MTIQEGSIPEAMTPEYRAKERELAGESPLNQLAQSLMGGLSQGLEESVGEYFDKKRDTRTMSGASDILSELPENFKLEDILAKGKEKNAHPDAIKMAIEMGKQSKDLEGKYGAKAAAGVGTGKETSLMKADVDFYKKHVETADKMRELNSDVGSLENMLEDDDVGGAVTQFIEQVVGRDGIIGGLMGLLESGQTKEFNIYSKAFFQRFKQVLEGRLNETEFKFITNAIPSTKYTKEQNIQILKGYKAIADKYMYKGRLAEQIRQSTGGDTLPNNFNVLMDKGMTQYEDNVKQQMQEARNAMKEAKAAAKVKFKYQGRRLRGQPKNVANLINDVGKKKVEVIEGGELLEKHLNKEPKTKVVNGQTFVKMDVTGHGLRWIPQNAVEETKDKIPGSKEL